MLLMEYKCTLFGNLKYAAETIELVAILRSSLCWIKYMC